MRRVPWLALGALVAWAAAAQAGLLGPFEALLPGCPFKALTGYACATCGLTRCLLSLGHGEWRAAFHWHPVAAAGMFLLPLLAGWDLLRVWRNRPYPPWPEAPWARWAVWALLLGIWALQVIRGI